MPAATRLPPRKPPKRRPKKPPVEPIIVYRTGDKDSGWDPLTPGRPIIEKLLAGEASMSVVFGKLGIHPSDVMDQLPCSMPDATWDPALKFLFRDFWPTMTPTDKRKATFDSLAADAQCPPDKLFGAVCRFLYWRGFTEAQAIIALNIPNVVRVMLENVLNFGELSQAERLELLRALGIINTAKNTNLAPTIINVQANANAAVADRRAGIPSFEDDMDGDDDWERPQLPAPNGAVIEMPRMQSPVAMEADDD
jgi:hypothetical protein